jgi:apoptosis-inducing factor 2
VVPGYEHKAFIPYSSQFSAAERPHTHAIVPARVLRVDPRSVQLDREWQGSTDIDFDYLVLATGTTLTQPSAVKEDGKQAAIDYLQRHQDQVKNARSILIAGGGAAGVQLATDLKEYFPDKQITLVQSRDRLMPKFHDKLHDLIKQRFDELGVKMVTGARVVVPPDGFSDTQGPSTVHLSNGSSLSTDFVILATGQQPNSSMVAELETSNGQSILNPQNDMVRIRPTLQFLDPIYDHLFAVGDIADTGAHKAARPGIAQAEVVTANIKALLDGQVPKETFQVAPAAIHMSLGMVSGRLLFALVACDADSCQDLQRPVQKSESGRRAG